MQIVFAGNDSEGLQYGAIGTPEKYFLKWKEDEADNSRFKLDKYLLKMCAKERLLELMHDFVLFDGGVKKLPRVHQYFGVKAAQEHVARAARAASSGTPRAAARASSWCCWPSGFWRTTRTPASLIVTDRDELDKQIEGVFTEAGETIYRTQQRPRPDDPARPGEAAAALLAGAQVRPQRTWTTSTPSSRSWKRSRAQTVGELFVFVDECHRTQSGKLHRTMKALMPGAVFIGFTGTPLLKKDRQTSLEVFGGYIHTYKFSEAVEDGVVLDLVYEARDIDQRLGSQDKIDAWFDAKTKGLNDWQKAALREQWGTMQKVLSSRSRMERVVERHRVRLQRQAAPLERARQRDPGGVEHLRGVQVLRAVPEDRRSRASARSSPPTTRRRRT